MMSAYNQREDLFVPNNDAQQGSALSVLNLVGPYLEELVKEEQLGHRAQVVLHQLAVQVCRICQHDPFDYPDHEHPALTLLKTIARIARLSGPKFEPGDALYTTLMESIAVLRVRNMTAYDVLTRANADLEHVMKLAKMRAPLDQKFIQSPPGRLSDAKMIAALLIIRHCYRFDVYDSLLYFSLTDWLAMIVVTQLVFGAGSPQFKLCDRMTFALFYLSCGEEGPQREALSRFLPSKLQQHIQSLPPQHMGHDLNFSTLHKQVALLTGLRP